QTGANGRQGTGGNGATGANAGNGATGGTGAKGNGANGANGANGGNGGNGANAGAVGATAVGKVNDVSKVADTSTGVGTYAVTVDFTADPTQFLIGSTVAGSITTGQHPGVLVIPLLAVTTNGNQSTVTVATDGTTDGPTEVRPVTLGARSGANVEVTTGLKEGDQLVVEIPAALANRVGGQTPTGASGPSGDETGGQGTRRNRTGASGPTGASGARGSGSNGTTP
ncbi:MAG TPA: hypothetical protein VKD67_04810, partial [Acidimicrobiales bacterium]|nr:hypothetical protein [Acidimicrobiales bacterium]